MGVEPSKLRLQAAGNEFAAGPERGVGPKNAGARHRAVIIRRVSG